MKKIVFNWLAMLLAVVVCAGVASCKDDDEDDGGKVGGTIVGTWRNDFSSGYVLMTFRGDGTGVEYEYDAADGMLDSEPFTWAQSGNTIIIRDEDEDTEIYENVSISSTTLKWTDPDGYTDSFSRQE